MPLRLWGFFFINKLGPDTCLKRAGSLPDWWPLTLQGWTMQISWSRPNTGADHSDKVLSDLSARLMTRNLLAIELQNELFQRRRWAGWKQWPGTYWKLIPAWLNIMYSPTVFRTWHSHLILLKWRSYSNREKRLIFSVVSDMFDQRFISERITKYFLCYPKNADNLKLWVSGIIHINYWFSSFTRPHGSEENQFTPPGWGK